MDSKLRHFILAFGLVLWVSSCGNGRSTPTLPNAANAGEAGEQANALATQAAQVIAEQGDELATQAAATIVAQTEALATQATEFMAEEGATLAAQGAQLLEEDAALLESGDIPVTLEPGSLAEKFATVPIPSGGGTAEITVTDDELNQAIAVGQAAKAQTGTPSLMQNPQVVFTGGYIVLSGTIAEPVSGQLTVSFAPYVADGTLQFDVVEASIGQFRVPPVALQTAESTLNSTLGEAMSQLPEGVGLQSIVMGEGTMTVIIAKA